MNIDLSDDMFMVDNLVPLTLISKGTTGDIDYQTGSIVNSGEEVQLKGCLIRQEADRLHSSVRQIFQRGVSIANDNIEAVDCVIEIPVKGLDRAIKLNDELQERDGTTVLRSWQVVAVDKAALNSRWRTACRIISRI